MKFNNHYLVALFICIFASIYVANAAPTYSNDLERRGWNPFEKIKDAVTNAGEKIKDAVTGVGEKIKDATSTATSTVIHGANNVAVKLGINTAAIGGKMLMMKQDDQGVYHADFDCWQSNFGYNKLYDFAFDIGTSMEPNKAMFSYGGQNYILWAWKGDYVNLGAGAELGIYYGGKDENSHWLVDKNLAMPMTLTLNHRTKGNVVNNWKDTTWWITAFNPAKKFLNVNANDLTVTFTVDFSKNRNLFNALASSSNKGNWQLDSRTLTAKLTF